MNADTLAQARFPDDLIPGSPPGLSAAAESFLSAWQLLGGAIEALQGLRVNAWEGEAAEEFRRKTLAEAECWAEAAPHLFRAGEALLDYRGALLRALAEAEDLIWRYQRSLSLTEQARDLHHTEQRRAQQRADLWGLVRPLLEPFNDPQLYVRADLEADLISCRARLDAAGDTAAEAVEACAAAAPGDPSRGWLGDTVDAVVTFPGSFIEGAVSTLWGIVRDTGSWLWDISSVKVVTDLIILGPERTLGIRLAQLRELGDGAAAIASDPGGAFAGMLGSFFAADQWAENPGHALGTAAINLGTVFVPGGAIGRAGASGRIVAGGAARRLGQLARDPDAVGSAAARARVMAEVARMRRVVLITQVRLAGREMRTSRGFSGLRFEGKPLPEVRPNKIGTTKVFDTRRISPERLESEVRRFADQFTGGAPLSAGGDLPTRRWSFKSPEGFTVTIRTVSRSRFDGEAPRWTVEILNANGRADGWRSGKIEFKFR